MVNFSSMRLPAWIRRDKGDSRNGDLRHSMRSSSFFQESVTSSVDFPAYIPWHSLSTDLSDKLKHGSIRINRSNKVEYTPILEEGERNLLIDDRKDGSIQITPAVRTGVSWPVAAFLLVNTALGSGVLNYPAAYDRAGGIAASSVLQIVLLLLLITTMMILAYCSDLNEDCTYHDVLMSVCGKKAQQLSALSILLTCYGICITFFIIIGDQYDRVFASVYGPTFCLNWYLDRRFTLAVTAIFLIWPMCYFQRLDFLRYAGSLGIFAMLYPVFLTIYEYFFLDVVPGPIKTSPPSIVSIFVVIPVFSFAYQTHEIVVPVYSCMKNRNLLEFGKATALATSFLVLVYFVAGTFGYLTFGSFVAADFMQQYDARDPVVMIGIAALIIKMITTYPLLQLCGRGALDGLYAEFRGLTADQFIKSEKKRRYIITTVWFITTLILGIFTPNIGVVIELLGCLASVNIFIFPGVCLISVVLKDDPRFEQLRNKCLIFVATVMIAFGAFVFGVVLIQVLVFDIVNGNSSHHDLCVL